MRSLSSEPSSGCAIRYRCGIILSEQYCASGEVPDVIGWKGSCQSVLVECKVSRSDFLADANKPFRLKPEEGLGSRRFYMAAGRLDCARRIAEALGTAGVQGPAGAIVGEAREAGPAKPSGSDEGDEPAAGEPAAGGSAHRAADHHRLPEVEEPPGRIQRWPLAGGHLLRRKKSRTIISSRDSCIAARTLYGTAILSARAHQRARSASSSAERNRSQSPRRLIPTDWTGVQT